MSKQGLIFALDAKGLNQAMEWVEKLHRYVDGFKIGAQFFCRWGTRAVKLIQEAQSKVFLDLKFHDIPFTVEESAKEAAKMGVWMFNVHTLGGKEMMMRAKEGAQKGAQEARKEKPLVIGVTILTSLDDKDIKQLGFSWNLEDQVMRLAELAKKAGLDGVVASPREVAKIKKEFGKDFIIVCPGIRFEENKKDDQKRTMGPKEAIEQGADYLVVGRPIVEAKDPVLKAKQILKEIQAGYGKK